MNELEVGVLSSDTQTNTHTFSPRLSDFIQHSSLLYGIERYWSVRLDS